LQSHILFVSLLNPALHRRIFFQLARTASTCFDWVSVLGIGKEEQTYYQDSIQVIQKRNFARLSVHRLVRQWEWYRVINQLAPTHICFATPELIPLMLYLKKSTGVKLIYDVHENYERNILYGSGYTSVLRPILALQVRRLERSAVPYLDGVIYAETGFDNILNVPDERKIILRNVYTPSGQHCDLPLPPQPYLLITGTLAPDWGILEAIEAYKIIAQRTDYHLIIAGYGNNLSFLQKIKTAVNGYPSIHIEGWTEAVVYPRIEQLIQHCTAGFALYQPSLRMADRVPTKFYEYAAYGKPLFFSDFEPWNLLNQQFHFGIPVIFDNPSKIAVCVLNVLQNNSLKFDSDPEFYSWEYERNKWIDWLMQIKGQ
jgi:glycosyltransferase involved in cell wall biosynthesis